MSNILFLTNISPFPGDSGGTINTRNVLDGLIQKGHCVTLCFLEVNKENNNEIYKNEYRDKLKDFIVIENNNNRRSVGNYIKSIFYRVPLNIIRNKSKLLKKVVDEILAKEKIDVVYCDHLEMYQYIPDDYLNKTIFMDHNAEHMIWKRYAKQLKNSILKIAVKCEAQRMCIYEKMVCDSVKYVLASEDDISVLKIHSADKGQFVLTKHLGNDELLLLPNIEKKTDEARILFIGTLTWNANIDGVNWFVREILPKIENNIKNVQFDVVGKYKTLDMFEQRENVHYHGFVEDLEPFYRNSFAFVCPLLYGSGTKIKIINALYRGIPIVTTNIGAESIELENGKIGFVTDDVGVFADNIVELCVNDKLWTDMSLAERKMARENFTWDTEIKKIDNLIDNIY